MSRFTKFLIKTFDIAWYVGCGLFACVVIGFLARVAWIFMRGGWGLIP